MTTHAAGYEVGRWSEDLFRAYRAAKGPRRAHLLNLMVQVNAPLAKTILEQLRGGEDRKGRHRAYGGCVGFRELAWDDAYQVALIALTRAVEQYDPKRGKFSSYVKLWMRAELQRYTFQGGDERSLIRVPRGAEECVVPVALTDDQGELDRLSGGEEDAAIGRLEGRGDFDPGDVRLVEWDPVGLACANDVAAPPPLPWLVREFIEARLSFGPPKRTPREWMLDRFEAFGAAEGGFACHADLFDALELRRVRPTTMRVEWACTPVPALAGVGLR